MIPFESSRETIVENHAFSLPGYEFMVSSELSNPEWDEFLEKTEGGHHTQTSSWAQVKNSLGWKPIRLVLKKNSRITAGAQILIRKTFFGQKVGYVPKGPLISGEDVSIGRALVNHIKEISRSQNCQLIAIQPPSNGYFLNTILHDSGFQKSDLELAPTASIVIDLSSGEDQILKSMKQKTRQHIRQSIKAGFEIWEGGLEHLDIFYSLYLSTARRQGFLPFNRDYFDILWEKFSPQNWINLIFISFQGEPITAQILIPFGDTVISKMIGWSGHYSELRPNEATYWASFQWAAAHGFHYFDLEGLNPSGVKAVLEGGPCEDKRDIFKYGFGGRSILFPPAYDYLPNRIISWVYHRVKMDMESETIGGKLLEVVRKR